MMVEVLLSTMFQKDLSILSKMNIQTDILIINQTDKTNIHEEVKEGSRIRMLSFNERGLSRSRNRAIKNAIGEICVIADDDLVYVHNYKDIIISAYKNHPEADIIVFDVPSTNKNRPTSSLKEGRLGLFHSMKVASFQITFKKKSFLSKNIEFNEYFGAGAIYCCGEENILLSKCLQLGLNVVYIDKSIATVSHEESTWFVGFNEEMFRTKGAMFYEISSPLSFLLVLQYAFRKKRLYKRNMGFFKACKFMLEGMYEYKRHLNLYKNREER